MNGGTLPVNGGMSLTGGINVANGVIQSGGSPITSPGGLGLFSLNAGNFMRFVTNTGSIRFYTDGGTTPTGGTAVMVIGGISGNIGMGTNSPSEKLEVNGNIRIDDQHDIFFRTVVPDGHYGVGYYGNDISRPFAGTDVNGPVLYGFNGGALGVKNGTDKIALRWNNNGDVGIGTTTPTAKLDVNGNGYFSGPVAINTADLPHPFPTGYMLGVGGKVIAEEFLVKLKTSGGWPDYVFNKNYELKGLDELEVFVKANKHLPGVPSAKEVNKNGLALADMVTKQMEKIEELSLYLIEMNKKIERLDKENKELKASIKK